MTSFFLLLTDGLKSIGDFIVLGPDPHSSNFLDPDPHTINADPYHWFGSGSYSDV